MLPYILLIATIGIFSVICFHKNAVFSSSPQILKTIFLSSSFLLLFIYSSARLNIGNDYTRYASAFSGMGKEGFSNLNYLDYGWEWGFNILTKIIYILTKDVRVYMTIIAAMCLAGPYYVIYKYSKSPWLSVLLYINLYFFYVTMNFMRQGVAISISLFAYEFLLKRKFLKYAAVIICAAMFHVTVLIMIPLYFLVKFKPSLKIPLFYGYLVLWMYIASNSTIDLILSFIYPEYRTSVFIVMGLDIINAVIPTLIVISGVFLMMKFIKPQQPAADSEKTFIIQTNLMYFAYFWIFVMLRHAIFERVSYYAYIYVILFIPELLAFADEKYKKYLNRKYNSTIKPSDMPESQKKDIIARYKRYRKLMSVGLTALVITITLLYNFYGLVMYPGGAHGIYPYSSWLI